MSLALAVLRDKMISARTRRERALAVAWRPLSAAAVRHWAMAARPARIGPGTGPRIGDGKRNKRAVGC